MQVLLCLTVGIKVWRGMFRVARQWGVAEDLFSSADDHMRREERRPRGGMTARSEDDWRDSTVQEKM